MELHRDIYRLSLELFSLRARVSRVRALLDLWASYTGSDEWESAVRALSEELRDALERGEGSNG